MKTIVILFALSACSGCLGRGDWPDVPTATITPIAARPELQTAWVAAVANQAQVWNSALEWYGCPSPFRIGEDGHAIRLIPAADWDDGHDVEGATDDYEVRIREHRGGIPPVLSMIIVHELGHAIGLGHASMAYGPSVMIGVGGLNVWNERDGAAAACEMGCGPCDDSADPYDLR